MKKFACISALIFAASVQNAWADNQTDTGTVLSTEIAVDAESINEFLGGGKTVSNGITETTASI